MIQIDLETSHSPVLTEANQLRAFQIFMETNNLNEESITSLVRQITKSQGRALAVMHLYQDEWEMDMGGHYIENMEKIENTKAVERYILEYCGVVFAFVPRYSVETARRRMAQIKADGRKTQAIICFIPTKNEETSVPFLLGELVARDEQWAAVEGILRQLGVKELDVAGAKYFNQGIKGGCINGLLDNLPGFNPKVIPGLTYPRSITIEEAFALKSSHQPSERER